MPYFITTEDLSQLRCLSAFHRGRTVRRYATPQKVYAL